MVSRPTLAHLLLVVVLALSPAVAAQEGGTGSNAARDWAFIQKLLADGMQDVAARQLESFAATYPAEARAADALLRAGGIWQELEQVDRAHAAYDQILLRHASAPAAATALLRKGHLLADAGRLQEAANVYRGVLSSYPASPEVDEARLALGEALLGLEQYDDAGRAFRYLIGGRADASVAARAMFDLGLLHQKTGADSLAVAHFDGVGARYPDQPIAAFGQLRAAALLEERQPEEARRRYERVVDRFDEAVLRARARLGLARLLEAEEQFKRAASRYREVVEEGGTAPQIAEALLGLARCELSAGRAPQARRAAEALLEREPGSGPALLLQARAALRADADDAVALAESLGRTGAPDVASAAWQELGDHHLAQGDLSRALRDYGRAAAVAEDASRQADALLTQAELAGRDGRAAWSLELAVQAAERAPQPAVRARALATAMRAATATGDLSRAGELGRTLLGEFPTGPDAREARALVEQARLRADLDPTAGWARVTEIALATDLSAVERAVEVTRTLRTVVGDLDAALRVSRRAMELAQTADERARVAAESGRTLEAMARDAAARGELEAAGRAMREARSELADAAAEASDRRALQLELLRLELAHAVAPEEPWTFDATRTPLLGGVGPVEAVDLRSGSVQRVASRLEATLAEEPTPGWVLWRVAELVAADAATRTARLDAAERATSDPGLRGAIRFTRAQLARRTDDAGSATTHLRALLESDVTGPLLDATRYEMAELHRGAKRYDPARRLYDQFTAAWPETRKGQRAALLAGDCALFLGDTEDAVGRYRELLERDPRSPYADDARYRLGTALMRAGDRMGARQELERLTSLTDSEYRGRGLEKLAELREREGDLAGAAQAWEQLREVDPELAADRDATGRLASLALAQDDPEAAVRWLGRTPESRRSSASTLELQVRALAAADRVGDAEAALEQLDLGHPDAADAASRARVALAAALERAQARAQAIEQLERAVADAADPRVAAEAAYQHGMLQVRAGDIEAARAAFAVAVERAPESEWGAEALFKVGNIASREGRDQEARRAFEQLARLHPGHELAPQALRGLASSWRREGRYDQALETYHQLLEQYPEMPDIETVLSQIAYCHHEMGQYDVSIAAYERVMPLLDEEGQGYAQFWIADSHQKLGRLDEAAAGFLRIPYLYPELGDLAVTAQLKAARVYEQMDRVDAAVRLYEKVLTSHGVGSQWGGEAKKRLDGIAERRANDSR